VIPRSISPRLGNLSVPRLHAQNRQHVGERLPVPLACEADRIIITPTNGFLSLYLKEPYMAGKALTKSEILVSIAKTTDLSRKQVASVFEACADLIAKNVGKKGPGMFVLPGLLKIIVVQKPAVPAHKGIIGTDDVGGLMAFIQTKIRLA
jgi:hypothetical protein